MIRKTRFDRHAMITLIVTSIVGLALVLALGEMVIRVFTQIKYMYTSAELFVPLNEDTFVNAKNAKGVTFEAEVVTDRFGFRIDPLAPPNYSVNSPSIMFIGDSVTFGVGVPVNETFVELIAKDFPQYRILNAAVVGHDFGDYKDFVKAFVPAHNQELRMEYLVLVVCLNDISSMSKSNIKARNTNQPTGLDKIVEAVHRRAPLIDHTLRTRSKLYLLMKSLAVDVSRFVFFADYGPYKDDEQVAAMFQQLDETIRIAHDTQVRMIVVLVPYEYQLRSGNPEYLYPQSILEKHLVEHGVVTFDLYDSFVKDMRTSKTKSGEYYLFGDPMHLSALGHARVRSSLSERLHQYIDTVTPRSRSDNSQLK